MADTPEHIDGMDSLEDPNAVESGDELEAAGGEDAAGEVEPGSSGGSRLGLGLAIAFFVLALVLAGVVFLGDGDKTASESSTGSEETTEPVGSAMAGPQVDVNVSEEAYASEPAAPDLSTPEAAVRSYIEWTSYAYRTAQSQVALPTMSSYQEVHVDSYVQYNIQQKRLLDQTPKELTFGEITTDGVTASVPVREVWEYRYISITEPGKVVSGPHTATYNAVYSLVKDDAGGWVVDSVDATAEGEVK